MKRGLRQGCGIAPMIYACWTIRLRRLINRGTHEAWTQQQCSGSVYADDKHFHWNIGTCKDLQRAVGQLRDIVCLFHQIGMQINFKKSLVVLRIKGRLAQKMMHKYTRWCNGVKYLLIRMADNDIHIPIQDTMPYLGTVLSYQDFEMQTAQHCISQANSNFAQLRDVLRTNGPLT